MAYEKNQPYVKIFTSPKTGKKLTALCMKSKGRNAEKTLTYEGYWCAQYLDITLKELHELPEGEYA